MKLKVCLLSLVCVIVLAFVIAGCGHKSASMKSSKNAGSHMASRDAKADAKPTQAPPAAGLPDSGLPFNNQPSTLDRSLNPLAGLNRGWGSSGADAMPSKPTPIVVPSKLEKVKPEQLLAAVQMRYRSAKTLKTIGTSTSIIEADGKVLSKISDPKATFLFKRPDKLIAGGKNGQLVSNGKSVVQYSEQTGRYAKSKLDKATEEQLLTQLIGSQMGVRSLGLLIGVDYVPTMSSMKLLKDTKIGGRDVFVLLMRLKAGIGCPKGVNATQTLWIGKKNLAIYRNKLVAVGKPKLPKGYNGKAPKLIDSTVDVVAIKCEFDSDIPDSKFVFNPPRGAKPIEDPTKNYLQNKQASDFAFTWTDGARKKLSDFRGQIVILDCWALPMCEKHLQVLQKVYEKHKDVQIVSICVNTNVDKVKKYLSEKGLSFPVVYANDDIANIFRDKYHVQILPTTYVIDKSGVVRDMMLEACEEKDINSKLDKIH